MAYEFIDEYFPELTDAEYEDASAQWRAWETFVDMLCMILLVRREQYPETSRALLGAGLDDKELVAALEPGREARFPEWEKVRGIYLLLLKKGEISDLEGELLPLWQFINTGMMTHIEIMAFLMAALVDRNRKYARIFNRFMGESGKGYPSAGLVHDLCALFLAKEECNVAILYNKSGILNRILTENDTPDGRVSKYFCLEQLVSEMISGAGDAVPGFMETFTTRIAAGDARYEKESFIHERELDQLMLTYAAAMGGDAEGNYLLELIGGKGVGKKYLLGQFADVSGRDILCVDMEKLLDQTDAVLFRALKMIAVMAICGMKLVYLENVSEEPGEIAKERYCISVLQKDVRQLLIGCKRDVSEALSVKGTVCRIAVGGKLTAKQKKKLWQDFANRLQIAMDGLIDGLVLKYSLSPGDMWSVLCAAAAEAEIAEDGERLLLTEKLLERHIREKSRVDFGASVTRLESSFTMQDLKLSAAAESEFQEAISRAMNRSIVNETFGFAEKLPYGRGISVLLYGPPGTGKTMAAGVFGNELGLDVYRVDLSQINSKYIGETEKNLENIFRVAQGANIILFFDEADALFAKRTEVSGSNDKFANSQTAYLLQKIEEYDGICILATNGAQNFDAAFKRRMTYMIPIEKPDREVRRKLWENVFPKQAPLSADVDFGELADIDGLSGAQIKSAALSAAYMAAAGKREIGRSDIMQGIAREYKKEGRLDFAELYLG